MTNNAPPIIGFEAVQLKNNRMYFTNYWFLFLQKLFDKIYNPSYTINTFSSSPVTVTKDYEMLLIDTTSGAITANLPTAVNLQGRYIKFKNTGTNNLTIDGFSTETIDGSTTLVLASNGYATIMSDGTNWRRIG
jgi:hypothetical protein